jgi:hypothetical protein
MSLKTLATQRRDFESPLTDRSASVMRVERNLFSGTGVERNLFFGPL